MIQIELTLRSRKAETLPHATTGFTPYPDCPLAVTHVAIFDEASRKWNAHAEWCVVHRATGFKLGTDKQWATRAEALAVLEKCDPTFAAWLFASADVKSPANLACAYKFRVACQS